MGCPHRQSQPRQRLLSHVLRGPVAMLAVLFLAGCGFKMQGVTPMPFSTLAITIPQNSQFGSDVRRAIRAASPDTVIIEPPTVDPLKSTSFVAQERQAIRPASPDNAIINPSTVKPLTPNQSRPIVPQARLEQVAEVRRQRVVSLNAQGKPEEFELTLSYTFRLVNAKNQIVLPDTTLFAARSMPFDDRVVQAKEGEAATLYKDMQRSLVARMMRRLTAPDIKQRWDVLNEATAQEDQEIETATPIQQPRFPAFPEQNPSLIPLPVPVNSGG